jgi:hypothetical protein
VNLNVDSKAIEAVKACDSVKIELFDRAEDAENFAVETKAAVIEKSFDCEKHELPLKCLDGDNLSVTPRISVFRNLRVGLYSAEAAKVGVPGKYELLVNVPVAEKTPLTECTSDRLM